MNEEPKKEFKTVGEYLDEASKRDLPTDAITALEAGKLNMAANEMSEAAAERARLIKLVDNTPVKAVLYRATIFDIAGNNCAIVYVSATDPTAAEVKILADHKARGMTNTIYVRTIERVGSSDEMALPVRLLL